MTSSDTRPRPDLNVYACPWCRRWHRQLFELEHAPDCGAPDWFVTTQSKAIANLADLGEGS